MTLIGFASKIVAVVFPVTGAWHVMYIILNDQFLSKHVILTLILTALFSFTCCLLMLSKICVLTRRSHAANKTVDQLWDTDLKFKNETDEVPYYSLSYRCKDIGTTLKNLIFKNPYEFCKFRPAYGMFLATGFVALFVFIAALTHVRERDRKEDLYCVAVELIVPVIMLISVIYFIANTGFYTARRNSDAYTPFEEFVQVPMKIVIGKTVAILLTSGGIYCLLVFFLFFVTAFCIIPNYLYHASDTDGVLKNLLPQTFLLPQSYLLPQIHPNPHEFLRSVLIIVSVACANPLGGMMVAALIEAKKSILRIIEKNWQRNLKAIAFLLEDTEAETLQDLKTALDRKRNQRLTEKEKTAFNYLNWPIWQTKAPFMLQKCENNPPELVLAGKIELEDKNKSGIIQQSKAGAKPRTRDYKAIHKPIQLADKILRSRNTSVIPQYELPKTDQYPSTSQI